MKLKSVCRITQLSFRHEIISTKHRAIANGRAEIFNVEKMACALEI